MRRLHDSLITFFYLLLITVGAAFLFSCQGSQNDEYTKDGRLIINYWEKWTGDEAAAMQEVVDKYNKSQDKVFVRYLSTSEINRKLLLATSGGNPPDLAGFWSNQTFTYAEKGALYPLDRLMKRDGLSTDDYIPSILQLCRHKGFTWGLPSTPASLALHYNKKLFREAGLDPEHPPQTIDELNEYADKLTKVDENGNITQMGFSPADPGWWNDRWCYWFGGKLVSDDGKTITADSPEVIESFKWIESFPKKYGVNKVQIFKTQPSEFASAQNLFIGGELAMQLQGVWMGNFIDKFNPDLEWGAAPFPTVSEDLKDTTIIECDTLVIPRGSPHVEEAWDFIKFIQRQDNMELLCLKQKKFSPLSEVSESFYEQHPNPYIKVFRRLAESPNAQATARISIYDEYSGELWPAFDKAWTLQGDPEKILKGVKKRMQPKLDRAVKQWERVEEERRKQWSEL